MIGPNHHCHPQVEIIRANIDRKYKNNPFTFQLIVAIGRGKTLDKVSSLVHQDEAS